MDQLDVISQSITQSDCETHSKDSVNNQSTVTKIVHCKIVQDTLGGTGTAILVPIDPEAPT